MRRPSWRRFSSRVIRSPYVAAAVLRGLINRRLWRAAVALFVLLLAASAVISISSGRHLKLWQAGYLTLITALGGGGDADFQASTAEQIAQVFVMVGGVALVPVITAAVIETMANTPWESLTALGYSHHVVVIGLGNVGTRVVQQLNDLGVPVVAVDKSPESRGAEVARQLGIPLIIGDASRTDTLRASNVQASQSLLALSTDDVVNLEAALHARTVNPRLRAVLRLFDGDFAELVQKSYGIMISRSVSYVAAPAFAAAMFEREVIGTIPVERRVLLVAEVPVASASRLDGCTVVDAHEPGVVRVIALTPGHPPDTRRPDMIWSPPGDRRLAAGDQLLVITTRAGLGHVLTRTSEPTPTP